MNGEKEAAVHWSKQKEQTAGYWHLKLLLILFKVLPMSFLRVMAFYIGFLYFVFSKKARTESRRFLLKVAPFVEDPITAKRCRSVFGPLRHIISFSITLVEKLQSWGGKISFMDINTKDDDVKEFSRLLESGQGAFLMSAHLGNFELMRALAHTKQSTKPSASKVPFTAIMDTQVTSHFTRMLNELNPQYSIDLVNTREIGPDAVIYLEEKIACGGIVTSAGDRTSVNSGDKNIMIPFLGEDAPFSPGIYYLAALMNAPVFFMFAMRRSDLSIKPQYDLFVHKNTLPLECSKKERMEKCAGLARSFAALMERYCKKYPFQWYNFYDFWSKGE
jgi:predicted LPLAT superfamily acyltransferase